MPPRWLFLLSAAESEMGAALAAAQAGDDTMLRNSRLLHRHDSTWRLTARGRDQARQAGRWLKSHLPTHLITSHHVSPYVAPRETAALLGLQATWRIDHELRERDHGRGSISVWPGRNAPEFVEFRTRRADSPMFARSVGGNALADVVVQFQRWFEGRRLQPQSGIVLAVCHPDVMRAAHFHLAGLTPEAYAGWERSVPINHGDVLEYVRAYADINGSDASDDYISWRRVSTGHQDNDPPWQPLERRLFSDEELLASIATRVGR